MPNSLQLEWLYTYTELIINMKIRLNYGSWAQIKRIDNCVAGCKLINSAIPIKHKDKQYLNKVKTSETLGTNTGGTKKTNSKC